MYAIAIDGELVTAKAETEQVVKILKVRGAEGSIEVASFDKAKRLWMPVCLDRFARAA